MRFHFQANWTLVLTAESTIDHVFLRELTAMRPYWSSPGGVSVTPEGRNEFAVLGFIPKVEPKEQP